MNCDDNINTKGYSCMSVCVSLFTSVKLAAYSHSAADSPKKVRVQKHPQKR